MKIAVILKMDRPKKFFFDLYNLLWTKLVDKLIFGASRSINIARIKKFGQNWPYKKLILLHALTREF